MSVPVTISDKMAGHQDISSVTARLMALCSRREYCSSDMYRKALTALDGDREGAAQVLEKLVSEKYVDDLRYSSAYARDKSAIAGWGSAKIRYMLSSKGVARDVIDKALLEIDESKADLKLEKLVRTKCKALEDDPQKRMKLLRYVVGRGYPYEEALSVIDRIIEEKVNEGI